MLLFVLLKYAPDEPDRNEAASMLFTSSSLPNELSFWIETDKDGDDNDKLGWVKQLDRLIELLDKDEEDGDEFK